jgi:hypothetical protein
VTDNTCPVDPFQSWLYELSDHLRLNVRATNDWRSSVVFATDFGSVDRLIANADGTFTLPPGLAHFVEHLLFRRFLHDMFEEPKVDRYPWIGEYTNAVTTDDRMLWRTYPASFESDHLDGICAALQGLFSIFSGDYLPDSFDVEAEADVVRAEWA